MPSTFQSCISITTRPELTGDHRWVICCGGANPDIKHGCVTGPQKDVWVQVACIVAFIGTAIAWGLLSGFLIWQANPGLVIVNIAAWIASLVYFLLTSCTDPGVLPRNVTHDNNPEATEQQLRDPLWCSTCQVIRPLGAHHCGYCDSCCSELDHHCGVVGQCIGARNKTWFAGMLGNINLFWWNSLFAIIFGIAYNVAPSLQPGVDDHALFSFHACAWTLVGVDVVIYVVMNVAIVALALCPTQCCVRTTHRFLFGSAKVRGSLFETNEPRAIVWRFYCGECSVPKSRVYELVARGGGGVAAPVPPSSRPGSETHIALVQPINADAIVDV